ncbi:MAG: hypothetical protein ACI4TK_05905 [Agathobacter sp.]
MSNQNKLLQEMKEMAAPLHAWLQNNFHPHAAIIIDYDGVKVIEDKIFHPIKTEISEG